MIRESEHVASREAVPPSEWTRTILTVRKVVNGYIVEEASTKHPKPLKVFYTPREVVDEVEKYFMGGEKV